ncbi:MAG: hypothetical protein U1E65_03505 [Myxococcota bacterium]
MGLKYLNLDETTRRLMIDEIERDIQAGSLYRSENLSPQGRRAYPELLLDAAKSGTDNSLASQLLPLLNPYEAPRRSRSGSMITPKMRSDAHEMLAEGEFNRFYIRALARIAEEKGLVLVAYRAKQVGTPRADSEAKIGSEFEPASLLRDLRSNPGVDTAFGLPSGPNSGLSVKLG